DHVVVQLAQVRGDLPARGQVETRVELTDDRSRTMDELRFLGHLAVLDAALRSADSLDRAIDQHHDELVRVGRRNAPMRRRAAVRGELVRLGESGHCVRQRTRSTYGP